MFSFLAIALLVVWCWLMLQSIINLLCFRVLESADRAPSAKVSIVIPARNEERAVGQTIDRALRQDYSELEVIVVNDASTDGTQAVIDQRRSDARLVPVKARELAPGWLGKPNALASGASVADGEWILFMDADIELHPSAVRDAVAACEKNGWDHLALLPEFVRRGFWEELLMPLIPTVGLVYVPVFLAFLRRTPIAIGGGAFALVRRSAFEAIGGFETIKASVVDDLRLAMELKKAGFSSMGRIGTHRLRLRMYHGLREIMAGFEKNAHTGFGRSIVRPLVALPVSLWITLAPFAWPVAAALTPDTAFRAPLSYLGVSLVLVVSSRALANLRLGFPLWPIALSPIASVVFIIVVFRSLRMVRRHGVVRWRGREYPYSETTF